MRYLNPVPDQLGPRKVRSARKCSLDKAFVGHGATMDQVCFSAISSNCACHPRSSLLSVQWGTGGGGLFSGGAGPCLSQCNTAAEAQVVHAFMAGRSLNKMPIAA